MIEKTKQKMTGLHNENALIPHCTKVWNVEQGTSQSEPVWLNK
jgi:hypothetical protein